MVMVKPPDYSTEQLKPIYYLAQRSCIHHSSQDPVEEFQLSRKRGLVKSRYPREVASQSGHCVGEEVLCQSFITARSMEETREIPFYPSTQFADLMDNPRSYFGYAFSPQEADEVVRQYEAHTHTKYVCYKDNFGYGQPIKEALKKRRDGHCIRFKYSTAFCCPDATPLPLNGIPFIILGRMWKQCQYGPDRRKNRKVRKRLRKSKKVGCPSKIILRDMVVYPQYKIKILSQKNERKLRAQERAIMDLTFLGTASCFPTPKRGVSSTVFRHDGECWMFDCGEGTQIQLMKSKLKASHITKIFITHLHGDHLFGLPGLLCTMSQGTAEAKKNKIEIYGPWGLRKYLRVALEMSRSTFNFSYVVHELIHSPVDLPSDWTEWHPNHEADDHHHPQEEEGRNIEMDVDEECWLLFEDKRIKVKAAPLTHRIPCFGYVIKEKTQVGKLKAGYLKERGIPPGPLYAKIKDGNNIVSPTGQVITPAEAIGPSIPGRKIVILGDTKDSSRMSRIAHDADILVHEATLNNEHVEKCLEAGHSTPAMAANFAASINAKSLVLFHVSQRFKALNEPTEEGEETVELLVQQASEAGYTGQVVIAEDLDTITIQRKIEEQTVETMEAVETLETDTAATS
ncbi:zinc phosphodiesterase ELAC protein 1-like isoform X2 [Patiria miniata]|uniref:Uncharacterized protein n=1 Tax=Patiria miniata TaxID=46514 RepID=A0A914BSA5_PATMI|nr:zinc phosphodiesterase ELAC protein 1-like isoform X2 [Patiria miniata]